jgi:PAS domain S-box-containing protein
MINSQTACHLIDTAADAIQADSEAFRDVLDQIPAAIYVTDPGGTITYFNSVCVELAGRTPKAGTDKWCVTWKLYTTDGDELPHDQCPMAVALREKRPVRDAEAIAERPDGTRFHFVPYPTPLFDAEGNLAGAVNLLMDISGQRSPAYLREQAARCLRLAAACTDRNIAESLALMAAKYEEHSLKLTRMDMATAH